MIELCSLLVQACRTDTGSLALYLADLESHHWCMHATYSMWGIYLIDSKEAVPYMYLLLQVLYAVYR